MLISCCELEQKFENLCVKIKENENLCDLKRKLTNKIKFENLFFCKKNFGYFDENEEKKNKILECLNNNKIYYSINVNLIIEIENEKFINQKLENIFLLELRNKLEIKFEYKFFNEMGIILDENKIKVFEIINRNKIKMKKINENNLYLIKEDELIFHNNNNLINSNKNSIKLKNNQRYIEENFEKNSEENSNNENNNNINTHNNKFNCEMHINENDYENINNENNENINNKNNNLENNENIYNKYNNENINKENKEQIENDTNVKNLNNTFNNDINYDKNELRESYEIYINGKKNKNLKIFKCKSNEFLNDIRKNFPKNYENLLFLNDKYKIPKNQEKTIKINEISKDNKLYLKIENKNENNNNYNNNNNNNNNIIKFDPRKYQKLANYNKSGYDYYLYPNNIFNDEEEKKCISLLLIGESGAGKSTFINALINFIMNVKYDDEHRFKIINENNNKNNNKEFLSQTKEVNIYYIKAQNGYPPIKIIDTPGFGDTQGIEFDNKIMSMIFDKFKTINELTSVCIISKSTNARFNFLERYIYNNIAKLFANIFIIILLNYLQMIYYRILFFY